jgi:NADPH:quinone reductase-like Zn-dependent oxidoreductase
MIAMAAEEATMKAIVHERYGSPDVLELKEVEKPELADDGVLVRVRATSVNRVNWYAMAGKPLLARPMMCMGKPKSRLIGSDFAGTVEAVGKDVTDFRPGDEVFGGERGAFAEYVCARLGVAPKPANLTFEEAAAAPVAALTALQGLRDHGRLRPGQRVLINGASGGVGTFAVQIAKALGAEVTAVCSTRNVDLVRSLGADRVVDYTQEDFTRSSERYDLMLDIAGNRSWFACRDVLKPHATFVIIGGPATRLLGPLRHVAALRLSSLRSSRKVVIFIAELNKSDMEVLRELLESGKVKPVVEKRYELSEIGDARAATWGRGHAQGKLVMTV